MLPPCWRSATFFREQAARAVRLARDSTDPMLQISLRKLAVEYKTRADELEDDEIAVQVLGPDPS
jgi:hypothetical protein